MMKRAYRWLILAAVMAAVLCLAGAASAATVVDSGNCGANGSNVT